MKRLALTAALALTLCVPARAYTGNELPPINPWAWKFIRYICDVVYEIDHSTWGLHGQPAVMPLGRVR